LTQSQSDLSHSSPNDGQGFAASTSTAVDGRGDASTLIEHAERDAFEKWDRDEYGLPDRCYVKLEDGFSNFDVESRYSAWKASAARASTPVGWQALQDELVAALRRSKAWIEVQMEEELGWPRDRIKNPPEGSHLHAINSALAKVAAPSATPESTK
jgi:hypothetical protein